MTSRGDHLPGAGCCRLRASPSARSGGTARSIALSRPAATSRMDDGADSLDLREVQEIVPRVHPDHVGDALFPALGMNADALEIGGGRGVDQAHVGPAQNREIVDRLADIGVLVAEPIGPQVLIVTSQRRA